MLDPNTKTRVFSVVIPAYNYAETLPRALESVLKQKGDDFEVLVVNDGSTDNTENIIEELHSRFSKQFRSVTRVNSGAAATRNYGIANTSADWLIFLDSDDALEPDALDTFREAMIEHPCARAFIGGHIAVEQDGQERYRGVNVKLCSGMTSEQLFAGYLIDKIVTPSNGATLVHRSLFEKVSFPEEFRNSEDIPVFAAMFACLFCVFIDRPINRVYKHPDSLRHNTIHADKVGGELIDRVFDETVLPKECLKYKRQFSAQRYLSMFRTFYLAGNNSKAIKYYKAALVESPFSILKISYTKKAIRCILNVNKTSSAV